MFYRDDWIMHQLELVIQFVIKMILGSKGNSYMRVHNEVTETLDKLLAKGRAGEAEDLLFMWKDEGKIYKEEALRFYTMLRDMSEDKLIMMDFKYSEIRRGIMDYFEIDNYRISDLINGE